MTLWRMKHPASADFNPVAYDSLEACKIPQVFFTNQELENEYKVAAVVSDKERFTHLLHRWQCSARLPILSIVCGD